MKRSVFVRKPFVSFDTENRFSPSPRGDNCASIFQKLGKQFDWRRYVRIYVYTVTREIEHVLFNLILMKVCANMIKAFFFFIRKYF